MDNNIKNTEQTKCPSITDQIAKVVKMADDFDEIIILYQKKDELGGRQGFITAGNISTNASVLWMIERFKMFLLGAIETEEIK